MLWRLIVVFAVGALLTAALAALLRAGLVAVLEKRGQRLDAWRRVWFHPEREAAFFIEAFLIVAFVSGFVGAFALPVWVAAVVAPLWALHLVGDLWTWLRLRRRPQDTLALHERGFFLLDVGPLWLRAALALAAAALYGLPPVRQVCDTATRWLLGWLA